MDKITSLFFTCASVINCDKNKIYTVVYTWHFYFFTINLANVDHFQYVFRYCTQKRTADESEIKQPCLKI